MKQTMSQTMTPMDDSSLSVKVETIPVELEAPLKAAYFSLLEEMRDVEVIPEEYVEMLVKIYDLVDKAHSGKLKVVREAAN